MLAAQKSFLSLISFLSIFWGNTLAPRIKIPLPAAQPSVIATATPFPKPTFIPTLTPAFTPTQTPAPFPTDNPTFTPTPISTLTPAPTQNLPTITPTLTPTTSGSWPIQSVSSMKETKDRVCGQRDQDFIGKWVDKAKELGVNYVALETPYDNPSCGNSEEYTQKWIEVIRSHGLSVWHRHMPLSFEGIYDVAKAKGDYLAFIENYIKNHASFFQEGDIFTPIPEPQNGGISGITYCAQNLCIFDNKEQFNEWLRKSIDVAANAFNQIGLSGKIKIGFFGFDGFVAWGSNNPDWQGILEDSTIAKMGNITIDHYPELIGQSMEQGLDELQARYPGIPIVIGEWGSAGTQNVEDQVKNSMRAAKRPGIVGFNYWHLGMGGNEALINDDFSLRPQFDEVQKFFKNFF